VSNAVPSAIAQVPPSVGNRDTMHRILLRLALLCSTLLLGSPLSSAQEPEANELSSARQHEILQQLSELITDQYVLEEGAELLTAGIEKARTAGRFDNALPLGEFVNLTNRLLQGAYPDLHTGVLMPDRYSKVVELLYSDEPEQAGEEQAHKGERHDPGSATAPGQPHTVSEGAPNRTGAATIRDIAGITRIGELSRDGLNQVGYIAFERFIGSEQSLALVQRFLGFFTESDRLIIDLRECTGGDVGMVIALSSHLFAKPTHLLSSISGKNEAGERRGAERWTVPTALSPLLATMPVEVLLSKKSFSAAESFAFGLQAVGRARMIGAPSGGGGFSNDFFPLGEGLGASISIGRTYDPRTGKGWQGTGVIPDIAVQHDHSLSTAFALITQESGRLVKLSAEEREIYDRLQIYTHAWYNADGDEMRASIAPEFVSTHTTADGVNSRNYTEQLAAANSGVGVLEPLYHNRIITAIKVQGERATADLILRATSHRIALRREGGTWRVARDDYRNKKRSG
jgi:hypothetical protein